VRLLLLQFAQPMQRRGRQQPALPLLQPGGALGQLRMRDAAQA
jgi:hypothetical protein